MRTTGTPMRGSNRDYVIDAFNDDMPYDRFLREQIAGDLLPAENAGEIKPAGGHRHGLPGSRTQGDRAARQEEDAVRRL